MSAGPSASGRCDDLRVLLMSPLEGRDPPSGDITYTNTLLENPPLGVRYITYAEAIDSGAMTIRGRRPRHGAVRATDALILALRGLEHAARGRVMFREAFWYVTVSPGAFDLVHQHLFTLRQVGRRVPAVSSAGYPLSVHYAAQERWGTRRAARAQRLDRTYARLARAHTPGVWAPPGDVLSVYTQHYRRHLLATSSPRAPVLVCGQGLPGWQGPARPPSATTVGFIGRDFERKGGPIALAAFERLRRAHPSLKMVLVTAQSHVDRHTLPAAVEFVADPSRDVVISQLLPRIDVLMLPTAADCGAPYGVIEALRAGVPVVTSDLPWLDERLEAPALRRVAPTAAAVAGAVDSLLDPMALQRARSAALMLWQEEFSIEALHRQLLDAYGVAVSGASR